MVDTTDACQHKFSKGLHLEEDSRGDESVPRNLVERLTCVRCGAYVTVQNYGPLSFPEQETD